MTPQKTLIFLGLIILCTYTGCDQTEKNTEHEEVRKLSFEKINFKKQVDGCDQNCTSIALSYPEFKDPKDSAFNTIIKSALKDEISNFILSNEKSHSIESLASSFLANYQVFKKEFPETSIPWVIDINIEQKYTNRNFVSLQMDTYAFTGGAHPNSFRKYLNIDINGTRITDLSYFFNSLPKLKDLAERKFRAINQLDNDESLSEAGFQFENDTFVLPENYGFDHTGIIFYYNSYEIAAYSEGPIEIKVPFSDLKSIYKHKSI